MGWEREVNTVLNYKGSWNADTNTPTIVSSTGTANDFYVVNVAGTTDINGIASWAVGDWIIFNDSVWSKIPSTTVDASISAKGVVQLSNSYNGTSQTLATTVKSVTDGLATKEASFTTLSIAKGGTNSGTSLASDFVMISSTGAIVESSTSSTELSYITGVTSSVQDQLDAKSDDNAVVHLLGDEVIDGIKKFGTSTNYTTFEDDGTLVFGGDACCWNDINMPISTGRAPAANAPTWTTFDGQLGMYTFAINDYIQISSQELMHSWKEGSTVELHVHWACNGVDTTDRFVKWEIEYTKANMYKNTTNIVFGATTSAVSETKIPASTTTRTHFYTSIVNIDMTGYKIGTYFIMKLKRVTAAGSGAPTSNPFGIAVGIHFESDTIGSHSEDTK